MPAVLQPHVEAAARRLHGHHAARDLFDAVLRELSPARGQQVLRRTAITRQVPVQCPGRGVARRAGIAHHGVGVGGQPARGFAEDVRVHEPAGRRQRVQRHEGRDGVAALWQGELVSHRGRYYTVDRARLYTLPDEPPPIAIAAGAPEAAELAGRIGDALVSTVPDSELVARFERGGGDGKPRYATLCPRVWAYLERDLSHPVLAPVAAWFDDNVPPELRGDPQRLAEGQGE